MRQWLARTHPPVWEIVVHLSRDFPPHWTQVDALFLDLLLRKDFLRKLEVLDTFFMLHGKK